MADEGSADDLTASLPDDVLRFCVFPLLSPEDLACAAGVSRRWHGLAAARRDAGPPLPPPGAARSGRLDCLRFAHASGFLWDTKTCACAANGGYFDCLRFAYESGCPWD